MISINFHMQKVGEFSIISALYLKIFLKRGKSSL